jgi:hypothetical protein
MIYLEVKYPIRCKIITLTTILKYISNFNYLGINISYETDCDVNNEIHKFEGMYGKIRGILKRQGREEIKLKLCEVMTVPTVFN